MIKPIMQVPEHDIFSKNTSLRNRSAEVIEFNDELRAVLRDLVDTMNVHDIAIGLSAPQIGINIRVAVINVSEGKREPNIVIINPRDIVISGKKDKKKESCMSIPHFRGEVERRHAIAFTYDDESGKPQHMSATGFLARVLSHEIDHLDGILYVDRMVDPKALEPVDFFRKDAKAGSTS